MAEGLTHMKDREAVTFAEASASPSRPAGASDKPVIQVIRRPSIAAASDGLPDATVPVLGFESIGIVAVRLMAEWSLPRMQMVPVPGAGEGVNPGPDLAANREEGLLRDS